MKSTAVAIPKPTGQILGSSSGTVQTVPVSLFRRWLHICEWALVALLLMQNGARTAPKAWRTLNTDFPNYYLTARLAHEHYDLSRVYEWIWLQRQRDHHVVDQRVVEMVPITPFSTLAVYPFALMPALAAKHCWLIVNLGLLIITLWFLRLVTWLPWRRILLIALLSFPLRVNFMFGQYYVLLLFLLTLSCLLYLRQRRFTAGVLVGLATGLKIFPIVYLLYFLRKRDWRAFTGGIVASVGSFAVSVLVFGREIHRVYLAQVLPATLRGESVDPYNLQAASLSSLLHRLFIYEPQLNPHPAMNAPWMFAVLHPLLQMVVLAPALLFAIPRDRSLNRVRLEWAAVLLASVTISTSATSYLFTLLILPVALIVSSLLRDSRYRSVALVLLLYVATGWLSGRSDAGEGWTALFAVPRLYVLLLLTSIGYMVLIRQATDQEMKVDLVPWVAGLSAALALSVTVSLQHQHGLYEDYKWRIPEPKNVFMSVDPMIEGGTIGFIALQNDGYHSATARPDTVTFSDTSYEDQLAITGANGERWIEHAGAESTIRSISGSERDVLQGESPKASLDGQRLAFMREERGRARVWVRALEHGDSDAVVTPPDLNVLEMSFLPDGELIFAAISEKTPKPTLFITNRTGSPSSLNLGESRYPSVSPDGHWLAYSRLHAGNWNLWVHNLNDGRNERLTSAECNDTAPTWSSDSQTLVYASDCGRGLWLSALCRRRVIPLAK
jgi:hypothetical protein